MFLFDKHGRPSYAPEDLYIGCVGDNRSRVVDFKYPKITSAGLDTTVNTTLKCTYAVDDTDATPDYTFTTETDGDYIIAHWPVPSGACEAEGTINISFCINWSDGKIWGGEVIPCKILPHLCADSSDVASSSAFTDAVASAIAAANAQIGNFATKTELNAVKADLQAKVGWAKVEGNLLKLYKDSAMTTLIQTVTLPSGGGGGTGTDTNTTYTFSISGNVITITDSDGGVQTITVPSGGGSSYDDTEVRNLISQKYTKPSSGIPASDLASGVVPTDDITANTDARHTHSNQSYLDGLSDSYINDLIDAKITPLETLADGILEVI